MNPEDNSIDRGGDYRFSFLGWTPDPRDPGDRIPVTVISGFLGSGKTTLLKHLLTERTEGRFALVVNDVGEVNIDAMDLRRNFPAGESAVQMLSELTQGCICCSIGTNWPTPWSTCLNTPVRPTS